MKIHRSLWENPFCGITFDPRLYIKRNIYILEIEFFSKINLFKNVYGFILKYNE